MKCRRFRWFLQCTYTRCPICVPLCILLLLFLGGSKACTHQELDCLLDRYLAKPEFYRNRTRGTQRNMIDNGQIFDLGLNRDRHGNSSAVDEYISRLEAEMDLVLITEFLDESLLQPTADT